jgi:hypothetical protein
MTGLFSKHVSASDVVRRFARFHAINAAKRAKGDPRLPSISESIKELDSAEFHLTCLAIDYFAMMAVFESDKSKVSMKILAACERDYADCLHEELRDHFPDVGFLNDPPLSVLLRMQEVAVAMGEAYDEHVTDDLGPYYWAAKAASGRLGEPELFAHMILLNYLTASLLGQKGFLEDVIAKFEVR